MPVRRNQVDCLVCLSVAVRWIFKRSLLFMNYAWMIFDEIPIKNIIVLMLFCQVMLSLKCAEWTINCVILVEKKLTIFICVQ